LFLAGRRWNLDQVNPFLNDADGAGVNGLKSLGDGPFLEDGWPEPVILGRKQRNEEENADSQTLEHGDNVNAQRRKRRAKPRHYSDSESSMRHELGTAGTRSSPDSATGLNP
jgi:hypothetical protein